MMEPHWGQSDPSLGEPRLEPLAPPSKTPVLWLIPIAIATLLVWGAFDFGRGGADGAAAFARIRHGADETARVFAALQLEQADLHRAALMYEQGKLRAGWLKVWDNRDQDGDVVAITGAGFSQTLALTHTPTFVPVLYVAGQTISLTGINDGAGGGVTVSVSLASGPLPLPPLAPGQTVQVPFP